MHPFFKGHNFYGFVHRGGDEEKTENTLEAFQYSSDLGFVFMETDVQSTSDGKVVIFHDSDLKRIAGLNKRVSDFTFKEIKEVDLILGGKIPSLEEALSSFPNLRFNIDIKVDSAVEETIRIVKNHHALNRVCLASFSTNRLKRIRYLTGSDLCSSMGQAEVVRLLLNSYGLNFKASWFLTILIVSSTAESTFISILNRRLGKEESVSSREGIFPPFIRLTSLISLKVRSLTLLFIPATLFKSLS